MAAFVEKYHSVYPTAVACLQRDLEACLTFYAYPKEHWKTIRTTTIIERLFGEVKRRSQKMAAAFRKRSELFSIVLRGHSQFAFQQTHHARSINQATRRRDFTQLLTYYHLRPVFCFAALRRLVNRMKMLCSLLPCGLGRRINIQYRSWPKILGVCLSDSFEHTPRGSRQAMAFVGSSNRVFRLALSQGCFYDWMDGRVVACRFCLRGTGG